MADAQCEEPLHCAIPACDPATDSPCPGKQCILHDCTANTDCPAPLTCADDGDGLSFCGRHNIAAGAACGQPGAFNGCVDGLVCSDDHSGLSQCGLHGPLGTVCRGDFDCGRETQCQAGACLGVRDAICAVNQDCITGLSCAVHGTARLCGEHSVATGAACQLDSDCVAGLECADMTNVCQAATN
jgi:hypothetical protein